MDVFNADCIADVFVCLFILFCKCQGSNTVVCYLFMLGHRDPVIQELYNASSPVPRWSMSILLVSIILWAGFGLVCLKAGFSHRHEVCYSIFLPVHYPRRLFCYLGI